MYNYTQEKSGKTSEQKVLSPGKLDIEECSRLSFHTSISGSEAPFLALVRKVVGCGKFPAGGACHLASLTAAWSSRIQMNKTELGYST